VRSRNLLSLFNRMGGGQEKRDRGGGTGAIETGPFLGMAWKAWRSRTVGFANVVWDRIREARLFQKETWEGGSGEENGGSQRKQ